MITDQQREVLLIAQEECAEVTQAISKIFRFGIDASHNELSNREHLAMEVGDLLCMIELMYDHDLIYPGTVREFSELKKEKLKRWSNIFGEKSE